MKDKTELPGYLREINRILIDEQVGNSHLAVRVKKRLPQIQADIVAPDEKPELNSGTLYLKHYKGKFLRFCPGTQYYRCCGYRIIHIGENCPLGCTYCILDSYFQDKALKVWANQEDLFSELEKAFRTNPEHLFRAGTGEFTDSLVLEPLTAYSRDLVRFLNDFPNVCLELKSKIADLSWMDHVADPGGVLPAWSLNSEYISREHEKKADCLESRLAAARTCAENGFRVCLHFDPIIHHPGWKQGYARTIEMLFDYLQPADIAYLSLGSFRCMPELKAIIEKQRPDCSFIYNQFVTGMDGKNRLFLPLRLEQFSFIVKKLRQNGLDKQIYFCMESDTVWKKALGYTPRDIGGLKNHLLRQAFARG
ncbi:MAG: radical SAM protein [Thermodesulfobacteriota bacterium]